MNSLLNSTDVVHRYVDNHNAGVNGIGWERLDALFDDDALLTFHGIPMSPVQSARAIVKIYRAHPPSERLELLEAQGTPDGARASYSWSTFQEAGYRAWGMAGSSGAALLHQRSPRMSRAQSALLSSRRSRG